MEYELIGFIIGSAAGVLVGAMLMALLISSCKQIYIEVATEQKAIDIDKACDTMESLMSFYGIERELMFRISKDVRKAMEE